MAKTPEEQFGVDLPEQEVEAPQAITPPPEDKAETPERPEWLPEKFKSPEDLARSYSELESKVGSQGSELADLRRHLEAAEQQQYQEPQWAPDEDYMSELFAENPVEATRLVLAQQLQELQQQAWAAQQGYAQQQAPINEGRDETLARAVADMSQRNMVDKYDDYPELHDRVSEIMMERRMAPHELVSQPAFEQHLEEAYKLAKYEQLTGQEQQLREAGVPREEIDRLRKQQAETLTARRSAPREELSDSEREALALVQARQSTTLPW